MDVLSIAKNDGNIEISNGELTVIGKDPAHLLGIMEALDAGKRRAVEAQKIYQQNFICVGATAFDLFSEHSSSPGAGLDAVRSFVKSNHARMSVGEVADALGIRTQHAARCLYYLFKTGELGFSVKDGYGRGH